MSARFQYQQARSRILRDAQEAREAGEDVPDEDVQRAIDEAGELIAEDAYEAIA